MARTGNLPTYDDLDDDGGNSATSRGADGDPVEKALTQKVARKVGWVPENEWTRNPDKWVDEDTYLETHTRKVGQLNEELRRSNAAAAAAIDEANARRRVEAEAEVRAAAEAGDADASVAAAKKLANASKPPRVLDEWLGRNTWFTSDPLAKAVAVEASNQAKARGLAIADELAESEAAVRKLFPHHFRESLPAARLGDDDEEDADRPAPRGARFSEADVQDRERAREERQARRAEPPARQAPAGEMRMSEARRPRVIEGGSRAGGGAPKRAKGFADLPQATQETFNAKFKHRGVDPEKYAANYFKDQ
jgi:hypothetical protein